MIGISIGALNTSIAKTYLNDHGKCKYTIVLSETSQRTIPSIISYNDDHRLIGEVASIVIGRNITKSVRNIIRVIGMEAMSRFGREEIEKFSVVGMDYDIKSGKYKVNFGGNCLELSNESIMTGFVNKIKQAYFLKGDMEYHKVIFSYPDYFTCVQYNSFVKAVNACNFKEVMFIPESIALSHYYGYNKWKDLFPSLASSSSNKSQPKQSINSINNTPKSSIQFVIFVDVGETKTSFILTKYCSGSYQVSCQKTLPFFGGRVFDELLFDYCVELFHKQSQENISNNRKCKFKLLEAIKKARKILTVNKDAQISIDSLFEDYDFNYLLTRQQFETSIDGLLKTFKEEFDAFYRQSLWFIEDNDIYGIEMAGDLMRTPCLQAVIKSITGKELSKCILTDECMSVGCALYGETLDHNIHLQKMFTSIGSLNQYEMFIMINNDSSQRMKLIEEGIPLPKECSIILTKDLLQQDIISLKIYYNATIIEYYTTMPECFIAEYSIHPRDIFLINDKFKREESDLELMICIALSGNISGFYFKCKGEILKYNQPMIQQITGGMNQINSMKQNDIMILREIEDLCLKTDLEYIKFTSDKNSLEGKCYQLKNAITDNHLEKKEYKGKPVMECINQIESSIVDLNKPNESMKNIEEDLKEIHMILFSSNDIDTEKIKLTGKINQYQGRLSEELMKVLSNSHSKYTQKEIDDLAGKLVLYQNKIDSCNDCKLLYQLECKLDGDFN